MADTRDLKSLDENHVGSTPTSRTKKPRGGVRFNKQTAREAGIASGLIRQDKILESYMQIARERGVYAALVICRKRSWNQGYNSRQKHELRREQRQTNQANQTSE
jgi:hypothetical protein